MDTTLRYVQQFGRSKRDNLKPTLLNKYHVGNTIDVYPFRMMDFGCFASTTDGLSGLLHNSEMTSMLQASLPEMIEKAASVKVRITKYDRRTGEVAFTLDGKEDSKNDAKTVKDETITDASVAVSTATAASTPSAIATESVPVSVVAATAATSEPTTTGTDLEPFQFTTSQPVFPEQKTVVNKEEAFSDFLDKEIVDIQKFLETVIKQPLSPAAKKMLKELLQQTSIFRFTYDMQTVVDDFEPDIGLQLVQTIERALHTKQP
jgi:predicted RNA-binding protein with RPS1 domain